MSVVRLLQRFLALESAAGILVGSLGSAAIGLWVARIAFPRCTSART